MSRFVVVICGPSLAPLLETKPFAVTGGPGMAMCCRCRRRPGASDNPSLAKIAPWLYESTGWSP